MTDRQPPQDLDAEKALLGSMMMDRSVIDAVVPIIKTMECFYLNAHRVIWQALVDCHDTGEPMDLIVVSDFLQRNGRLEACGGKDYMIELAESFGEWANAEHYAKVVYDKWALRELIACGDDLTAKAYAAFSEPADLSSAAISKLDAILKPNKGATCETVPQMLELLPTIWERKDDRLATGFTAIDSEAHGMHKPGLVIVGAATSVGKTSFALQVSIAVARSGGAVLFISREMASNQISERILNMLTGHPVRRDTPDNRTHSLYRAKQHVAQWPMSVVGGIEDVHDIAAESRRVHRRRPLSLIVVDYLQLCGIRGKFENQNLRVAAMCKKFVRLRDETGACVMVLSQLNRAGATVPKPSLSMLRDSGEIEQDADMVFLLSRVDQYADAHGIKTTTIQLAKNRNGPTFERTLVFDGPSTTFRPEHAEGQAGLLNENSGYPW